MLDYKVAEVKTKHNRHLALLGLLALLSVCSVIACRPEPPAILVFSATPPEINIGESTTLKWVVKGATAVSIDQGIGDVADSGSIVLSPAKTVAYNLTAVNDGVTTSKSVVVTVSVAPPVLDKTAPVIGSISASSENETSVVITWITDELSTGQVEYGENVDYGTTATSEEGLISNHSISLSNLMPDTTYHYRVRSKDKAGNEALSADYTFTTPAPKSPYSLELRWCEWGRKTVGSAITLGPQVEKKYLFIKGSVCNSSRSTLRGVACTMNCWSGTNFVKFEVYVHPSPLLPGQYLDFDIQTADDPTVDNVTIEFTDILGRQIEVIKK
jgi:PKD repeat protein